MLVKNISCCEDCKVWSATPTNAESTPTSQCDSIVHALRPYMGNYLLALSTACPTTLLECEVYNNIHTIIVGISKMRLKIRANSQTGLHRLAPCKQVEVPA